MNEVILMLMLLDFSFIQKNTDFLKNFFKNRSK